MLEVSNWGLFAIMLVFVFFGGFAGGWNTGYKYKEKEDKIAEDTPQLITEFRHVVDLTSYADISDGFIEHNGFTEAQQIASEGISRGLGKQAMKYCDLHMEHDPHERKYTFKARLRVLDNDGEPLVIPEAWKRFND